MEDLAMEELVAFVEQNAVVDARESLFPSISDPHLFVCIVTQGLTVLTALLTLPPFRFLAISVNTCGVFYIVAVCRVFLLDCSSGFSGNLLPWNAFIKDVDYFGISPLPSMLKWFPLPTVSHGGWSEEERNATYLVTVAAVVTCGLANRLIAGSLIGSAGKLPIQYMQAIFAGTLQVCRFNLANNNQGLFRCKLPYKNSWIVSTTIQLCKALQNPWRWSTLLETTVLDCGEEDLVPSTPDLYNLADFVGKSLTAIYVLQSIKKDTWGFIARLLFYLLSTACLHGPKWLKGEIPVAVLTAYVYAWTD
ncbi:hypothetical protein V6N11_060058 [Hibiscus sabdariffa]|uniref:Uncharacterized protein n=1 Tax=Hibiscus sabdariffa TaxID=183260 RepID=A0ABR1ZBZ5_9ROSI